MRLEFQNLEAEECVSLDDAKEHCRIDSDDEDAYITSLIVESRQHAENWCGTSLLPQTWKVYFDLSDCFIWNSFIKLPHLKIMSITSIKSYADDNAETTFDPDNYFLSGSRIILNSSASWPTDLRKHDCLVVEFISGYGQLNDEEEIEESVPAIVKKAFLELVLYWHENRSALYDSMNTSVPTMVPFIPHGVLSKLQPYKRYAI
jgi:uncharacterized phiE125 gp8 family phage protein